jgi:quercetin dioxygenase-like cupin family protein
MAKDQGSMKNSKKWAILAVAILALLASGRHVVHAQQATSTPPNGAQARVAFSHVLPPMRGDQLKATVVEVSYRPGGSSPAHSHPCPVIGYVLEGALRTQVAGEPEAVYNAGQSFYEGPNGIHQISANASTKEPVKFLAYFVCDHDAPLTGPPPRNPKTGGK